jgi:two-component system nitrate/nitrite response regulator NarL
VKTIDDLRRFSGTEVDIVVMELCGSDGIVECCEQLIPTFPEARHVVIVPSSVVSEMILAFRQGIDGLILGGVSCDQLASSLHLVALGEPVLPAEVADHLLSRPSANQPAVDGLARAENSLSPREVEVLGCLTDGSPNKIIGRSLNISEATVKLHVKSILQKLKLSNRTQAAIWASRNRTCDMTVRFAGI